MNVPDLIKRYPLISDQISPAELTVVLQELARTLEAGVEGSIVEFGCYIGTTSLFIRRLTDREFHVYDSFEGLPDKVRQDSNAAGVDFKAGELMVSKKQFLTSFQRAHLQPPIIHKGWFNQLPADAVPNEIAFAFLDGDFYDSILSSLKLVWPNLAKSGKVLIHDYQRETLPGVEKAVQDFFHGQPPRLRVTHNIAIIET